MACVDNADPAGKVNQLVTVRIDDNTIPGADGGRRVKNTDRIGYQFFSSFQQFS